MTWDPEPAPGGWQWTDPNGYTILVEYVQPTARGLAAWVELRAPDQDIPVTDSRFM